VSSKQLDGFPDRPFAHQASLPRYGSAGLIMYGAIHNDSSGYHAFGVERAARVCIGRPVEVSCESRRRMQC